MGQQIILDTESFAEVISALEQGIDKIDVGQKWEEQGEASKALQAFETNLYELEEIMILYKKLLTQDIGAIKKAGKQMETTDSKISKQWK